MEKVEIRLFGGVDVAVDGERVKGFRSQKTLALLAYLAVQQRPLSRDQLAGLFWPDVPQSDALGHLRRALHNLTKNIPDRLDVDRRSVALSPRAGLWVDIWAFEATGADSEAIEQTAVSLAAAPFLEGVFLDDCPEVDRWIAQTRSDYQTNYLHLLERLQQTFTEKSDFAAALDVAQQMATAVPWREDVQRGLMLLLARNGRLSQAFQQYTQCERALEEELGVPVSNETAQLYQRLRQLAARPAGTLPPLPPQFTGRQQTLQRIASLFDTHRLVSLVGLDGYGKTAVSLAFAHAQTAHSYLEGVHWVALPPASVSAAQLEQQIIDACHLSPDADAPLDGLAQWEALLIFDGVADAHKPVLRTVLDRLLSSAPQLHILLNGERPLNHSAEATLSLGGLGEATLLFDKLARQIDPNFSPENPERIDQICTLLDRMPLAIELAAGWLRVLPLAEIYESLTINLELLMQGSDAVPIEAIFQRTWAQLSEVGQKTAVQLAVYSGIRNDHLRAICSISTLTELIENSLLLRQDNRYQFQPLFQKYVLHITPPNQIEQAKQQHAAQFAQFAADQLPPLKNQNRQTALEQLRQEQQNVLAGWQWASNAAAAPLLKQYIEPLFLFFEFRNAYEAGVEAFDNEQATDHLLRRGWFAWRLGRVGTLQQLAFKGFSQSDEASWDRAFAHLLIGLWAAEKKEHQEAARQLNQSIALWQTHGDAWGMATAQFHLGRLLLEQGLYDEAERPFAAGLAAFSELGIQYGATTAVGDIRQLLKKTGNYVQALEICQTNLAQRRQMNDPYGTADSLEIIGSIQLGLQRLDAARESFQLARQLRESLNDQRGIAQAHENLGLIAFRQGKLAEAQAAHQHAVAYYRSLGNRRELANGLHQLAFVTMAQAPSAAVEGMLRETILLYEQDNKPLGKTAVYRTLAQLFLKQNRPAEAKHALRTGLSLAKTHQSEPMLVDLLLVWAQLAQQVGDEETAVRIASTVGSKMPSNQTVISALDQLGVKRVGGETAVSLLALAEALLIE